VFDLPLNRLVHSPIGSSSRQGSGLPFNQDEHNWFIERYNFSVQNAVNTYSEFCTKDLAPEVARMHLPLATYTRKRWKCDLHNLLHFLGLRIDGHAQKEIQNYANAVATFTKQLFPISYQAFEDYRMNAVTFSKQECQILAYYLNRWMGDSDYLISSVNDKDFLIDLKELQNIKLGKTELQEFKNKLKKVFG
jgi:thymidylate synthase ThyX